MRQRSPANLVAAGVGVVALFLVAGVAATLQGTPRIHDVSLDWIVFPTPPAGHGDGDAYAE